MHAQTENRDRISNKIVLERIISARIEKHEHFSKVNARAKCFALRCFLCLLKYDASWFILL